MMTTPSVKKITSLAIFLYTNSKFLLFFYELQTFLFTALISVL